MDEGQTKKRHALAVVRDPVGAAPLKDALDAEGMTVTVLDNVPEALAYCRNSPPDLVVADDVIGSDSGVRLIGDLLAISWTTATILITTDPEEEVHDRAEGLGILGTVTDYADRQGLQRLMTNFRKVRGG